MESAYLYLGEPVLLVTGQRRLASYSFEGIRRYRIERVWSSDTNVYDRSIDAGQDAALNTVEIKLQLLPVPQYSAPSAVSVELWVQLDYETALRLHELMTNPACSLYALFLNGGPVPQVELGMKLIFPRTKLRNGGPVRLAFRNRLAPYRRKHPGRRINVMRRRAKRRALLATNIRLIERRHRAPMTRVHIETTTSSRRPSFNPGVKLRCRVILFESRQKLTVLPECWEGYLGDMERDLTRRMNLGLLAALNTTGDPVCAARDEFGVVHRAILKETYFTGYVVWLIDLRRKIVVHKVAALPSTHRPENMHNAGFTVKVIQCQNRFLRRSKVKERLLPGRRVILSVLSEPRNESSGPTVLIFNENFKDIFCNS